MWCWLVELLVLLFALPVHAVEPDKSMHFLASYAINTTLVSSMQRRTRFKYLKAAALTTAVGVAKELSDREFSNEDLAADVLGTLTSTAFALTFSF